MLAAANQLAKAVQVHRGYLRTNLEPSILASPDGHRWALAAEALERCEAIGGDELHIKLLKTIAVVDMFKERSGLVANSVLLEACFPQLSAKALGKTLDDLDRWSFTIFKKFLDAHAIFAGSDFDIDQAVRAALDEIDAINFTELKALAGLQPILAKRHYHETGALRWFDVNIVPVSGLVDFVSQAEPKNGAIGEFLLAIPTEGEDEAVAEDLCRKAARYSDAWDIVVGISKRSWAVVPLARELFALENVSNDHPELQGDAVARREVAARLASLQALLETELHKAFDNALWFRKNHQPKRLRQADLNSIASDLADRRFEQSPSLHNELLNRQKPSSNAIAAQNNLLRRMVLNEGEPRLGIEGFPAEGGLFASILESTGLYARDRDVWRFLPPTEDAVDPCGFPSTLDEVFGVTNNKQNATVFSQMAQFDWRAEANAGESMSEFRERIKSEGDPRSLLLPIVDHIRQQIQEVRKRLKKQTEGRRTTTDRHDKPTVEDLATSKFRERAEQGHSTEADNEEFTEADRDSLEQDLKEDKHYTENVAEEIANAIMTRKRKVVFLTKAMESYAFFNIEHKQGGLTAVVFNTNHPFYEQIMESLEPDIGDETDAELMARIHKAADTLELLFAAWARYELEEVRQQNRLFEMRQEWGKMARFFLTEGEDE